MGCPQGGALYTPLHFHGLGTVQASVTHQGCICILSGCCGVCRVGCVLLFPVYMHTLVTPPARRGCVGCGVCRVWGCRVGCGGAGLRGVSLYICTRLSPPPLWGGVWCAVCRVGRGVPWGLPYTCTRLSPPRKGHKKSGAAMLPPRLCGVCHFWLLFMPPRLRMVSSVSAISSGVYPAAANAAPSLSSSTAFVSIQ